MRCLSELSLSLLTASAPGAWNSTAVAEAWCDTTTTFETRAAALVANLTLKEKSELFNVVMMLG